MSRPTTLPRPSRTPTVAVWKFASCDGCQLSLLDCEDELLAVADAIDLAVFHEASSDVRPGRYDLSLVEGSVSTAADVERIHRIRADSDVLVTIGACATAGGIQALRNIADVDEFTALVYPRPELIESLATSTPIADHVAVDYELRGCPIDRRQLLEVITAFVTGRPPRIASTSVCTECKTRGTVCLLVARGQPCLGPVTHAGCGALCPAFDRGCYGCFGPAETAAVEALDDRFAELGVEPAERLRWWRGFNGWSPAFRRGAGAAERALDAPVRTRDERS